MPDDRATSATFLERLRGDEPEAWRRLVHLYGPLVAHWCRRRGLGREDAEDVTQEVFRAVAAGFATFRRDRPGDSFRGWLFGVTRNQMLMHLRKAGGEPRGAGGTDAQRRLSLQPDAPDDADDAPELQALYRRAVDLVRGEFEERTFQAFWRTAVDARPADAVAAELGLSVVAVRKAKSRVLRRLKDELGEVLDDAPVTA